MNEKDVFKYLKELGCCNACCFRYLSLKSPHVYESPKEFALKFQDNLENISKDSKNPFNTEATNQENKQAASDTQDSSTPEKIQGNGLQGEEGGATGETDAPPSKRLKWAVCVSCVGVLQEETWPETIQLVRDVLDKKRYACPTFACALSAPMATLLREKAVTLMLAEKFTEYDPKKTPTALKEAWKWSFGSSLAAQVGLALDSGAVSPLLVTVHCEYPLDAEELEPLQRISPALRTSRVQRRQRCGGAQVTRRAVEQALQDVALDALRREGAALPDASVPARAVSVVAAHAPLYLGGRYIKLSRSLPQTPWVLRGERMMDSSVQEIICGPIAELYGIAAADVEHRLKFISAGREDVDVRCLGRGRPFAIEVSDPPRAPSPRELQQVCEQISRDGRVRVAALSTVDKEQLTQLKLGEETKCKTYEALCIKLSPSLSDQVSGEQNGGTPVAVTQADIDNINSYSNVPAGEPGRVRVSQRTPIRVLHRRPLLTRPRLIHELSASKVPGHEALFVVRVRTQAGTYVKEWAHGECGRSTPALRDALSAQVDILALDVATVHLDWPLDTGHHKGE